MIDEIRADDALFAYATVDTVGGRICVVSAAVTSPSQGSCGSSAWGSPNFVTGVGTTFVPLEGPMLRIGTWRLLGESPTGNSLSPPFTVLPCEFVCRPELAQSVMSEWKAAAGQLKMASTGICTLFALKEGASEAQEAGSDVVAAHGTIMDLLGHAKRGVRLKTVAKATSATMVSYGLGFVSLPAPEYRNTNEMALALLHAVSCRVQEMYEDIENDPPDPAFQDVAHPFVVDQPDPAAPTPIPGELADALAQQLGYGRAQLAAVERYQGATEARARGELGASSFQHAQAHAAAENGFALVAAQRDTITAIRQYADYIAADPALMAPAVEDDETLDALHDLYDRVRTHGFTPEEMSGLAALGLSSEDIIQVREWFNADLSAVEPGRPFAAALRDSADAMEDAVAVFDRFAREAQGVATSINDNPSANFTCLQTGPRAVRCEATYIAVDLDPLTYEWDLGDGTTANDRVVEHEYSGNTPHAITLRVFDGYRTAESSRSSGFVPCCAPVAAFHVRPVQVRPGEPVQLMDASADDGAIVSRRWVVSGQPNRTEQNPTYVFDTPGRRSVQLEVTDDDGFTSVGQGVIWVLPPEPPAAAGCDTPADNVRDNIGNEFLLTFLDNSTGTTAGPFLSLHIAAEQPTSGIAEMPGTGWSQSFEVTPGTTTRVDVPALPASSGGAIVNVVDHVVPTAVRVCTDGPVSVHGLNRKVAATDGFLALPTDVLGTDHVVTGYEETLSRRALPFAPSNLAVVGIEDGTQVTITPAAPTLSGGQLNHSNGPSALPPARAADQPYTIELDRYGVYYLESGLLGGDLSGTIITSDRPVAVFGGSVCSDVPVQTAACDHLVEQLPPTGTWGNDFIVPSHASRSAGDLVRIAARDNGTAVTVAGLEPFRLERGEYRDVPLGSSEALQLTSSAPVLVMQYARGQSSGAGLGDPLMSMAVPPAQFKTGYTIDSVAPQGPNVFYQHWLNLTVPTGETCTVDGEPVAAAEPVDGTPWSVVRHATQPGTHVLRCNGAAFGVSAYGFMSFESYGYPGGLALDNIAPPPQQLHTGLGYSGDVEVQYSDVLDATAVLFDISPGRLAPLSGQNLTIAVGGGGPATVGPTDQRGEAGTSLQLLQQPGPLGVRLGFASAGGYASSAEQVTVRVIEEDCTLTYTGATSGAGVRLAAEFGEPDSSLGDLSGKLIAFLIDGELLASATTDAGGRASVEGSLPPGAHELVASFAGDDYYHPCDANPVTVEGGTSAPTAVRIDKTENGQAPTKRFTFRLTGGPTAVFVTATTLVDDAPTGSGHLEFTDLLPGPGYELCELALPAGMFSTLQSQPGATVDTDTGDVCLIFTLGAGTPTTFAVDNRHPAEGTRTIGYWRNWSTCRPQGGADVAARAARTGHPLTDDQLPQALSDGSSPVVVSTCKRAVEVLSTPSAKAAEHAVAAHLLAAMLNRAVAGSVCPSGETAIREGRSLLTAIGWNGDPKSKLVQGKHPLRAQLVDAAGTLERFNAGQLCTGGEPPI